MHSQWWYAFLASFRMLCSVLNASGSQALIWVPAHSTVVLRVSEQGVGLGSHHAGPLVIGQTGTHTTRQVRHSLAGGQCGVF